MKLLCIAPLALAAQPTLRRRSLIAAAPLTLLRPARAADARYVEQRVIAELGPDGQPIAYETVKRLTGDSTGLDLTRNVDISSRIFVDRENWPATIPFSDNDFKRYDENDDALFYPDKQPRLVYHVDGGAVSALTNYYKREIKQGSDVLDICSSWVSHYPQGLKLGRVAGTGMNERELKANTQLTEHTQRDLNKTPQLPYKDKSFDVVTCVVSIDYLTQPIQVLAEARRVLRPGGTIILSQSNRMFMTKAIRMWVSMGDEDHLELIGQYLKYAGGFGEARAFDVSAKGRGARDPMYIVTARAV